MKRRECIRCHALKTDLEFALNTKRGGKSYSGNVCKVCRAEKARYRRLLKKPMFCACGNESWWYDAIDFATGSTWHLCRYCGLLLPVKSTWRTNYQALQWVG